MDKKSNPPAKPVGYFFGGAKGSRTPDLLNAIQTRYQLRYNPKKEKRLLKQFFLMIWWRQRGSNPRPHACEACALTN